MSLRLLRSRLGNGSRFRAATARERWPTCFTDCKDGAPGPCGPLSFSPRRSRSRRTPCGALSFSWCWPRPTAPISLSRGGPDGARVSASATVWPRARAGEDRQGGGAPAGRQRTGSGPRRWALRLPFRQSLQALVEQAGNSDGRAAWSAPPSHAPPARGGRRHFFPALPVAAGLAAGCAGGCLPLLRLHRAAGRRLLRFEEQFPTCLEFVARSMRAGHGFSVALEMAPEEFADPLGGEFQRASEEHRLGMPLDQALRNLGSRVPSSRSSSSFPP